jgi:uncharacterized protein (TIGR03437 family)
VWSPSLCKRPPAGTILNAGTQTLTAIFSGGGTATVTLTVNPGPQTITFGPISNRTTDSAPLNLQGSASSGLPVVYSIVSGSATVAGNLLTITGPGTIVVKASQPRGGNFAAATPVTVTFSVAVGRVTITSVVNSASFGSAAIAADAFSTLFGNGLAIQTASASALPLPTNLGGTTVLVTDSRGNSALAGLNYVSLTQINFVTPEGLVTGSAQITVTNSAGNSFSFSGNIAAIAPALFSADSSGTGAAVAQVLTVNADGTSQLTTSFTCAGTPVACTTSPIALNSTARFYLTFYGTGIRGHESDVTATIGGVPAQVLYAGAQPTLAGLDQVNIVLDPSLAGKGVVTVQLTVDGVKLNPVTIAIQ